MELKIMIMNYELPQMKYAKQTGLISIIVPIYNTKEVFLKECLDSILSQTFEKWEAILVNDGSTNNIGKIIDEYAEKDSRFIAIHKQNEGTALARKTGLENSKGEFIANLDSDDIYYPLFIEKMHAKITETGADFVWCMRKGAFSIQAADYNWNADAAENVTAILLGRGPTFALWEKLVKRDIYTKILTPNQHFTLYEDVISVFQIAYYSNLAAFVPEYLYYHRDGGLSMVKIIENTIVDIKGFVIFYNTLLYFFKNIIPQNIKAAFYSKYGLEHVISFYLLDNRSKDKIKVFFILEEWKTLVSDCIKHIGKIDLKICLFLAKNGICFPLVLRKKCVNIYTKLTKKRCFMLKTHKIKCGLKKIAKAVLPYGILYLHRVRKEKYRSEDLREQKILNSKIDIFCKYFLKTAENGGESYFEIAGAKLPDVRQDSVTMKLLITLVFQDTFLFPYCLNDNYEKSVVEVMDIFMYEGPYGYKDGFFDVSVKEGDVVIDAGAWIGDFSAYASSKGAVTYAFEPVHYLYELLQKTATLNKDRGEIFCIEKGLSNQKGEFSIRIPSNINNNAANSMAIKRQKDKVEMISVTTLDDFAKENKITKIDFIKADIEGEERNLLRGASWVLKNYAPKLAICTYHFPEDPELLEKIILEANPRYKIVHLRHKLFAQVWK